MKEPFRRRVDECIELLTASDDAESQRGFVEELKTLIRLQCTFEANASPSERQSAIAAIAEWWISIRSYCYPAFIDWKDDVVYTEIPPDEWSVDDDLIVRDIVRAIPPPEEVIVRHFRRAPHEMDNSNEPLLKINEEAKKAGQPVDGATGKLLS